VPIVLKISTFVPSGKPGIESWLFEIINLKSSARGALGSDVILSPVMVKLSSRYPFVLLSAVYWNLRFRTGAWGSVILVTGINFVEVNVPSGSVRGESLQLIFSLFTFASTNLYVAISTDNFKFLWFATGMFEMIRSELLPDGNHTWLVSVAVLRTSAYPSRVVVLVKVTGAGLSHPVKISTFLAEDTSVLPQVSENRMS